MMMHSKRLSELGINLPSVAKPVGSYVPAVRSGSLVMTSGQLPMRDGMVTCVGKVPSETALADAAAAASLAMLNAVAAASEAAGGIDRIQRVLRVGVFVNSSPGFHDQPKVANGASDLLVQIFGEAGRHARAAVGVAELPLNAAVEVELMAEVAGQ